MHAIVLSPSMKKESIANMIYIAFYYCMRSGKYTSTTTDSQAFALKDITLYNRVRRLNNATCTYLELQAATQTVLFYQTK